MMGLTPFEKGHVNLLGQDITDMTKPQKKDLRKKVQLILQNPYESFNLLQRIDQSLLEPLFVNGIVSNKSEGFHLIHEMFRLFRLDINHLDKMPTELSGGELQRVAIVRGMLLKPECLICDEVISALDVSLQIEVLNRIFNYVREKNQSCIFITHNIATIKNYADRIIVMKDGQIIEEGKCEQIIFNPQLNYTKKLIQGIPKWHF
jgi:peptide/nickel transport system ATP-binding protein